MMINAAAYLFSALTVLFLGGFMFRQTPFLKKLSRGATLATALLLVTALGIRTWQIRFPALTNTFESLLLYSLVILVLLFWYFRQNRLPFSPPLAFLAAFAALALLLIASSPLTEKGVQPPIPALQSAWLVLHVLFAFIGEAFFVFATAASILVLRSPEEKAKKELDKTAYALTVVGYAFFTIGALIFGAIWAENAWGAYWSWDPKETWALITWLVYSFYLHYRLRTKNPNRLAWISILGFLSTLFTFFGVNYLLSGLHSYV